MQLNAAFITLTLALAATPAAALDLSSYTRVYVETYDGETAFPLTPETDLLETGRGLPAFSSVCLR